MRLKEETKRRPAIFLQGFELNILSQMGLRGKKIFQNSLKKPLLTHPLKEREGYKVVLTLNIWQIHRW